MRRPRHGREHEHEASKTRTSMRRPTHVSSPSMRKHDGDTYVTRIHAMADGHTGSARYGGILALPDMPAHPSSIPLSPHTCSMPRHLYTCMYGVNGVARCGSSRKSTVYQSLYMMLRCLSILTMASETPASDLYVEYSPKPPNLPTHTHTVIITLVKFLRFSTHQKRMRENRQATLLCDFCANIVWEMLS